MISNIPTLDLNGEIRGIIKKEVHDLLKKHKDVLEYHLDNFNSGCTLVKINKSIDDK